MVSSSQYVISSSVVWSVIPNAVYQAFVWPAVLNMSKDFCHIVFRIKQYRKITGMSAIQNVRNYLSNETVSCPRSHQSLGMYIFVKKGSYYLATANRTWPPVPNSPGCTGWSCAEFFCCYIDSFSAVLFANRYAQRWIHTCDGPLPASSSTCNRTLTTQQSLNIFVLSRQWENVNICCKSFIDSLVLDWCG